MKNVTKGSVLNNYHPITYLSSIRKLFSSILSNMIYQYLEANKLLIEAGGLWWTTFDDVNIQ